MPAKKSRRTGTKAKVRSAPKRKASKPSRARINAFANALKASKTGGQDVEGTKGTTPKRRGGL